jgi:hypothetical protein
VDETEADLEKSLAAEAGIRLSSLLSSSSSEQSVRCFDFVEDIRDAARDDLREFWDGGGNDEERKRELREIREATLDS